MMRLVGSMILFRLSEESLEEAFVGLWDAWTFEQEQLALGPPIPLRSEVADAQIVESVERPILVIDE